PGRSARAALAWIAEPRSVPVATTREPCSNRTLVPRARALLVILQLNWYFFALPCFGFFGWTNLHDTVPLAPGGPCFPVAPDGPLGPFGPAGPAVPPGPVWPGEPWPP